MIAALRVESLKLTRSPVGAIATIAIIVGTVGLLSAITAGVASGNPDLIAKSGPAASLDWGGLLAGSVQITAVAALLGFGIVLAWIFGREFADGTIVGLFALPTSRSRIALAKVTVHLTWAILVSTSIVLGILTLGLALGYGVPERSTWAALARLWTLAVFSACLVIPVAWIATATRSVLAAVASTIALIVLGQFGALSGVGGWVPAATPALWAMSNGTAITPLQLAFTLGFSVSSLALVCWSWARLQLDH